MSTSRCPRCDAALDDGGCYRCGLPAAGNVEELARQERLLAFLLDDLSNADDIKARIDHWRDAGSSTAPDVAVPQPAAPTVLVAEPAREESAAELDEASPPQVSSPPADDGAAPSPVDPPVSAALAPNAPVVDTHASAARATPSSSLRRDLLARRMEVGGWFLGVLCSVGGSLWATNLFWGNWSAAVRLAVVGAGLALYAALFIGAGALLGARHPTSLAGAVLGLVGRLVAISASLPLASLIHESVPTALLTDVLVIALLGGTLTFSRRREHSDVTPRGQLVWLLGTFLVLVAPAQEWLAVLVIVGAVALAAWSLRERDDGEEPRWTEDVASAGITLAAIASAASFVSRTLPGDDGLAPGLLGCSAWLMVVTGAAQRRAVMQRHAPLARWIGLVGSTILAVAATSACSTRGLAVLYVATSTALVAWTSWRADRDWLPVLARPVLSAISAIVFAYDVDVMVRAVRLDGAVREPLAVAGAGAWLLVVGWPLLRERVNTPPLTRILTLASSLGLAAAAIAVQRNGWASAVALALALVVMASDRRAERSVLYDALVIGMGLAGFTTMQRLQSPADIAIQSTVAVGALLLVASAIRHARRGLPLTALTSSSLAWLTGLGVAGLVFARADGDLSAPLAAGALLFAATLVSRSIIPGVVGVALLMTTAAAQTGVLSSEHALSRGAIAVGIAAFLGLLPTPRSTPRVPLLVRRLDRLGRSSDAASIALCDASALGALFVLAVRVSTMWTWREPGPLASCVAAVAVLALFIRARDATAMSALVVASAVALADVCAGIDYLLPVPAASVLPVLGLTALWLLVLVVMRARQVSLRVVFHWRARRGKRKRPIPVVWNVVATVGIVATAICAAALSEVSWAMLSPAASVVIALLCGNALLMFASRPVQPLLLLAASAPAVIAALALYDAIAAGDELGALFRAMALIVYCAVLGVVARSFYAGRRWLDTKPNWLAAWPRPVFIRSVAFAILTGISVAILVVGGFFYAGKQEVLARQYVGGLAILAIASAFAWYALASTRRTLAGALTASAGGAFALLGAALALRATGWLPPSTGMGQAQVAWIPALALLLLDRRWGRALMVRLRLGYVRATRVSLVTAAIITVYGVVAIGLAVALADPSQFLIAPVVVATAAVLACAAIIPTRWTAWPALGSAMLLAAVIVGHGARLWLDAPGDWSPSTQPWLAAVMLLVVLLADRAGPKLVRTPLVAQLHRRRALRLSFFGHALRRAARVLGFVVLGIAALAAATTPRPEMSVIVVLGIVVTLRSGATALLWPTAVATAVPLFVLADVDVFSLRVPGLTFALVGWGGVALLVALTRDRGRALLATVGLAIPRRGRAMATMAAIGIVLIFVGRGLMLAVTAPYDPALTTVLVGCAALAALMLVVPSALLTWLGAAAITTAGGAAGLLMTPLVEPGAPVRLSTLPAFGLGVLVAASLMQFFSKRFWCGPRMRALHDEEKTRRAALQMRVAAERIAFLAFALIVVGGVIDGQPTMFALACTWLSLGVSTVLFSRIAISDEQPLLAAMAHGAALAIYVDLRRRTGWLDGIEAVDAFASLAAAAIFFALRSWPQFVSRAAPLARASELYASTLPIIAAAVAPGRGSTSVVLIVGGALYAALARTRRLARYELAGGAALVVGTIFALMHFRVSALEMYLFPIAVVGTFLARRHRAKLGRTGAYFAVGAQVPVYAMSAWTAVADGTMTSFAVALLTASLGVAYAVRARDRRVLYAALVSATVLVVGKLVVEGMQSRIVGVLLLVGVGIAFLVGMTVLTVRREAAREALQRLRAQVNAWDDEDHADSGAHARTRLPDE